MTLQINIYPMQPTGYGWTARDGDSGPVLAQGRAGSDIDAERIVKRLFGTVPRTTDNRLGASEPVDMTVRYRNGTGRHEMIR